ncbi:MAG: D-alanyl-D-alanine carboxypeptidase/D-alanyl-D-alanine-endopeptidase, partial [Chitinophagaceae bacterium]
MKTIKLLGLLFISTACFSQSTKEKFHAAFSAFEKDEQFKYASIGLLVVNSNTGEVVLDKNANTGFAPASTQKIVTSAAAYELLGKDFTYKTQFSYDGIITKDVFKGELVIKPSGDPSLG